MERKQKYEDDKVLLDAWILQHGITWQHPDMLAMPNKANALSWTSADRPFLDFNFKGGSAIVGRTKMPSFFKQNEMSPWDTSSMKGYHKQ